MLPEQQQRILGYFIEEARDHLNTIEQGLLNLQGTLNDPEMINEVFRAAHSIKGGAAMLGLSSIQHTSHRLEDYFKILKEHPVQIDQKLESLFLGVSDTLKALLEHLTGPFGLTEEVANTLMSETEPVFQWLHEHLEILVQQGNSEVGSNTKVLEKTTSSYGFQTPETNYSQPTLDIKSVGEFQAQVLQKLRLMLQLFKQQATTETRQKLQECCYKLAAVGEPLNFLNWSGLCRAAGSAIANPENSYLTLAKTVITEIKQALELATQNRDAEIAISPQLEALLSVLNIELLDITADFSVELPTTLDLNYKSNNNSGDDVNSLQLLDLESEDNITSLAELSTPFLESEDSIISLTELSAPFAESEDSIISLTELSAPINFDEDTVKNLFSSEINDNEDNTPFNNLTIDLNGPEVGVAELNALADFFEGQTPDLEDTWQKVEILDDSTTNELEIDISNSDLEDTDSDLADFLSFDKDSSHESEAINREDENLTLFQLFDDDDSFLKADDLEASLNQEKSVRNVQLNEIYPLEEVSQEFAFNSIDLEQSVEDITQNENPEDVISNLLALTLDEKEIISLGEVAQLETLSEIAPGTVISKIEIFPEPKTQAIASTEYIEARITQPEKELLSLDSLFGEPELEKTSLISNLESGDLFDSLTFPTAADFSEPEDDLNDFWLQETEEELTQQFDIEVEQDAVKALEESLFAAAASGDIFAHTQQEIIDESFDAEDKNLTFLQQDLTFLSDLDDDLFAEVVPSQLIPSSLESQEISTVIPNFSQQNGSQLEPINNLAEMSPSLLDFAPEFTNTTETPIKSFTLEFEADNFDDSSPFFADTEKPTVIQIDTADSFLREQNHDVVDDLFAQEIALDIGAETAELPLVRDSEVADDKVNHTLEAAFDLIEKPFDDVISPNSDLDLINDLFATEGFEDTNEELLLDLTVEESEISDVEIRENEFAALEYISSEQIEDEKTAIFASVLDEFADLEALLEEGTTSGDISISDMDFADLEALLGEESQLTQDNLIAFPANNLNSEVSAPELEDEFSDLEKLLKDADQTRSHTHVVTSRNTNKTQRPPRRGARFEETMRVPVKHLDDMSNLVGELVVNRNTLEQDQERQRQSLDNLLIQIHQLSDVGSRMQELYERSLLEASLLASRKNKEFLTPVSDSNTDRGFSELEMDRFTPFHTLSQEMIELIVRVRESASDIDFITDETERVARQFRQVTTQLQEGLTKARMEPFSQATDGLQRGVRDTAIKYGRQVELVIEGKDTFIDKMIVEHLKTPLTHMLNNAIAHGIEIPQVRQQQGKPPVGTITVRAFHQGNQTIISVKDDGAGINTDHVKLKAIEKGLITAEQAKTMSDVEVYDLLFEPNFSTKDEADELSGRGVGMDAVLTSISEIRGTISTDSTLGKGTSFTIRLPLTLSICKALCCVSDKARIAFPMDGVEDTLDIPAKNIHTNADGESFISWRDIMLPFRPLKELLTFNRLLSRGNVYAGNRDDDMISVIVVRSANTFIALQIDQVLSEQEIVIKQFERPAPKPIGVAGATVLGDGRIMPIADVLEIIDIFQGRTAKQSGVSLWEKTTPPEPVVTKIDPTVLIVDDSITVRELLSLTFNKAGYRVEQARDGQEAWDKLRSGLPCDIVFCDIEMPRCDGLELLSRIQKDSSLNHLPIAMLTSRGADKHRQMAVQLGASGYFTKPYLEEALLEAASRMLKGEKLLSSANNL